MTPSQLFQECRDAMSKGQNVVLTMPVGRLPKGFPRGELLNEMKRNGVVERTCRYEAVRVLVWLEKNTAQAIWQGGAT